jgi:hypothetical protein
MMIPLGRRVASRATTNGSAASAQAATMESDYRLLTIRGLSPIEAGNVVAYLSGLHAADRGWTVEEIKHLLAIRALVAHGVIDS